MKLKELSTLPERAGQARLAFVRSTGEEPYREGERIVLPHEPEADFWPLQNGEQFVYGARLEGSLHHFFGGTDERPFLVEIEDSPVELLRQQGEKAFYQALMPPLIQKWSKRWQREPSRQGDIWSLALPLNWLQLKQHCQSNGWSGFVYDVRNQSIFATHHRFTGLYLQPVPTDRAVIGEGVIEAPDHQPIELPGPHLFDQTPGIKPVRRRQRLVRGQADTRPTSRTCGD